MRGVNRHALFFEDVEKAGAHGVGFRLRDKSSRHSGLIADDNQQVTAIAKLSQRCDRVREEIHIFSPADVAMINNQRSVSIEEKGFAVKFTQQN